MHFLNVASMSVYGGHQRLVKFAEFLAMEVPQQRPSLLSWNQYAGDGTGTLGLSGNSRHKAIYAYDKNDGKQAITEEERSGGYTLCSQEQRP